jgi:short-subunit dehydrogenase
MKGQTWWLIGASEGLGRALAQAMADRGARLILSARQADKLADLAATLPDARALAMDVTDADSVRMAAEQAGEVDGVIYLSGAYWPMRAQDWDTDRVLSMLDVNLNGAVRVMGAVLPGMVARGRGRVLLTGSLSAYRGLPGAIGYGASKAGLMNLAESMQCDLQGTGVQVQLANPGFIRTRLTDLNSFDMPFLMEPEAAAAHMLRILDGRRGTTAFPMLFSWLFRAGRFLPDALWNRIFAR